MAHPDHAAEIRSALSDPRRVCERFGLAEGAQRQSRRGMIIRCPAHGDRNPSCSVTVGPDGTLRWRCFSCDASGDVLTLAAVVCGLDVRTQFRDVLFAAAELGGLHQIADELRTGEASEVRPKLPPAPPPEPPKPWPEPLEVIGLWDAARPADRDPFACAALEARAIDPVEAAGRRLARVLAPGQALPPWARYRGVSWADTGHRLVLRMWDASGVLRAVRGWRITDGDTPKRLPPSGCRHDGIVLANEAAWRMLRGDRVDELVISEGEPDWLTWATRWDGPVIGIISGSWCDEMAEACARAERVVVRTDRDEAGDRYAAAIAASLRGRCELWRAA